MASKKKKRVDILAGYKREVFPQLDCGVSKEDGGNIISVAWESETGGDVTPWSNPYYGMYASMGEFMVCQPWNSGIVNYDVFPLCSLAPNSTAVSVLLFPSA